MSPIVKIKNQLNKLHNHDQDIQSELIQTAKSKSSTNTDVVSVLQIATCIEKDGGHSDKLRGLSPNSVGSLNSAEHFGTFQPIVFVLLGHKYIGSDDDQKPS